MTDYTDILPADDIILTAAGNGGTPYDVLCLDIDFRGDEPDVSLVELTIYGGDGVPVEVWKGQVDRTRIAKGEGIVDLDWLREQLKEGGSLSIAIDAKIEERSCQLDGPFDFREDHIEAWVNRYGGSILDKRRAVWHVGDWLAPSEHEIAADMTDEQIAVWAADMKSSAVHVGVHLIGDAAEWARKVRDEKAAEIADAE